MRILVIDDDPAMLRALARQLNGHEVLTASGVGEARAILAGEDVPDVVLTDYFMPDGTGLDVLREAHRRCPEARRYIASGNVANVPGEVYELADAVLSKGGDELTALIRDL